MFSLQPRAVKDSPKPQIKEMMDTHRSWFEKWQRQGLMLFGKDSDGGKTFKFSIFSVKTDESDFFYFYWMTKHRHIQDKVRHTVQFNHSKWARHSLIWQGWTSLVCSLVLTATRQRWMDWPAVSKRPMLLEIRCIYQYYDHFGQSFLTRHRANN